MSQDESNDGPATSAGDADAVVFEDGQSRRIDRCIRDAVDQLREAVVCVSEAGTVVFANRAVERVFGYPPEELVGESLELLVPGRFQTGQFEAVERFVRSGDAERDLDDVEIRCRHEQGHDVRVRASLEEYTEDDERLVTVVLRAPDDRGDQEDGSARERAITESVLRAIPDVFYLFDEDATLLKWNDRVREVTGYTDEEVEEMSALEFVAPEDREAVTEAIATVFEEGGTETVEADYLTKDGERIPYEFTGTTVTDEHGEVVGLTGIGRDVSERKRHERELEAQRERLETELAEVYRRITDAVIGLDEAGRLTYANDRATTLLERAERSMVGEAVTDVLPDRLAEAFHEAHEESIEADGPENVEVHEPTLESWFDLRVYPSATGASVYLRDVSDRKQFERTLTALHESSRSLLSADTATDVCEHVLAAADDVIEVPWAGIYLEDDGELRQRVGSEDPAEDVGDPSTITVDGTPIPRRSFDDRETITIDDCEAADAVDAAGTAIRSAICAPLGDHGVLATVSSEADAFDDEAETLVDLLAANAAAALDRVAQEERRRRRERQLEALAGTTGALLEAQTPQDVCEVVVDAVETGLDVPIAAIALYDDGGLQPRARTALANRLVEDSLFEPGEGVAWTAFVDDRVVVGEDRPTADPTEDVDSYDAAAIPLGGQGVLLVGTVAGDVSGDDLTMAQILTAGTEPMLAEFLAANTESSLERAARERRLVERDELLREQNERLERLTRVSDVVRDVDQALVDAESRAEIDHAVCSRLTAAEPFAFSWIGEIDHVTESVTPRERSGVDDGYLDVVTGGDDDGDEQLPAARALETGEPRVVEDVLGDPPFSRWRKAALEHGYRSCMAIPLTYRDMRYGVLSVYADRPNAFGDVERTVLAELDRTVGHAINAIERTKALVSDDVVEIEFVVRGSSIAFLALTTAVDCAFELDRVVSRAEGGYRVFFTVDGADAEDVLSFVDRFHGLRESRLVSDAEGAPSFECVVDESSFVGTLLAHGAMPRRFTAEDGEGRVVVALPGDSDVRSFVEMIRTTYEESEFLARRERRRERATQEGFETALVDSLTDRQREVLLTAYECGFFETPRESSGSDVSDVVGVSQPTLTKHLRAAQRKLVETLIDKGILDGTFASGSRTDGA